MKDRIRVLLVEHVDAAGSAPVDATSRAAALRGTGVEVEAAVLEDLSSDDLLYPSGERAPRLLHSRHRGLSGREALRRRVSARDIDLVLWASASPGGGDAGEYVCEGVQAAWWPTGWGASDAVYGELPCLDGMCDPLTALASDPGRGGRGRLSLWDGPFVLAATAANARATVALIDSFADASRQRDDIDLVLLADRDPRASDHAAMLGVGARVHWVGRAPREAENCWLQTASAVVLDSCTAVAGSLVLRACAAGAPLLVAAGGTGALASSLGQAGLCAVDDAGPESLAHVLERPAHVERARQRGRELAASLNEAALTRRAARALSRLVGLGDTERAA